MQKCGRADVASCNGETGLLDERVAAIVECDGSDDFRTPGLLDELSGFARSGREGLVRNDVFAVGECSRNDLVVQIIRCRNVDDLHFRIVDQRFVVAIASVRSELFRFPPA